MMKSARLYTKAQLVFTIAQIIEFSLGEIGDESDVTKREGIARNIAYIVTGFIAQNTKFGMTVVSDVQVVYDALKCGIDMPYVERLVLVDAFVTYFDTDVEIAP